MLFKRYSSFSLLATLIFSVNLVISYGVIYQYRVLALDQVNIDRNVQGCRFPLVPKLLVLDVIFRRKKKMMCTVYHVLTAPRGTLKH